MEAVQTAPQRKFRKDYREPDYWVREVELEFDLGEDETLVRSRMRIERNDKADADAPLFLHGRGLEPRGFRLDGAELVEGRWFATDEGVEVPGVPASFVLETLVAIRPQDNTSLMGLYRAGGTFCTQCEAEGFRKITWFVDRPDNMARFTVTIRGDKARCPVMLSNGNRVAERDLGDGRHEVRWVDPYPKPSYLFALVAGDLRRHAGDFRTRSGRDVALEIWVEPQNIDRCEHALASLRKAMAWDEERFGLEYDLDLYMIVAVNDFNMGAMENKGLNVFNSKFVLARPDTATDGDYEAIEAVIAHEYFHNWTGNRVTCRDWFQLTLKEGLTVYRDQEFTSDVRSRPVKRIDDVKVLRLAQWPEDDGPMAHPIRPESYVERNNFYTATVYNKGAEVIRMYEALLGRDGFRRGMDLYFERWDGQAVTCDDFRAAMADANGRDLGQFERWYLQSGTPTVEVREAHDPATGTYELELRQRVPVREGQEHPLPFQMPLRLGLLGPDGEARAVVLEGEADGPTDRVLELREERERFRFTGHADKPVASLFRGLSAPVRLAFERPRAELAFLMANDDDAFNRWEAGQALATSILVDMVAGRGDVDPLFVEAWGALLTDARLDGSLKALALGLPSERVLAQEFAVVDPAAIHAAARGLCRALRGAHAAALRDLYDANAPAGPYSNDKASIDRRRLRNLCLDVLCCDRSEASAALATAQFDAADNMTDSIAALRNLAEIGGPRRDAAIDDFHARWQADPLVLDKWFTVQALSTADDGFDRVRALAEHPDFLLRNPNRFRSLVGAFGMLNQVHFHRPDGAGYRFLADQVLAVDPVNAQVAARVVSCFNQWKRFEPGRRALMLDQLRRIRGTEALSKDVGEIVDRALAQADDAEARA